MDNEWNPMYFLSHSHIFVFSICSNLNNCIPLQVYCLVNIELLILMLSMAGYLIVLKIFVLYLNIQFTVYLEKAIDFFLRSVSQ